MNEEIQDGAEEERVVVVSELCRLCGARETRMLYLEDTFDILGATSTILNLLTSISIFLKVQDDCEELMPKRLCFSCFNTAVDIQAFVDSGINFQKTTISQLFPDARVETFEIPFTTVGASPLDMMVPQNIEQESVNSGIMRKQPQQLFGYSQEEIKSETGKHKCSDDQYQQESLLVGEDIDKSNQTLLDVDESHIHVSESTVEESVTRQATPGSSKVPLSDSDRALNEITMGSDEIVEKNTENMGKECKLPDVEISCRDSSLHSMIPDVRTSKSQPPEASLSRALPQGRAKRCPLCKKTFPRQSQVKSHLASHSSERPYECPICSVRFKYRRNLVEHAGIHTNNPSFICFTCGLTFKQKSNLLKHERTHRGKHKPNYKCKLCGLEYTQSSHLKTHMNNVHGDHQGYECRQCKVVVMCKSSLRRHEATVHALSTKFTCPHCNKGFNNYHNYEGHVRRHTGERPYSCSHCPKTFTTTKALTRHTATHEGARTHKCPQCNKAFLEMCDLKKHMRRHQQRQQAQRPKSQHRTRPQEEGHASAQQPDHSPGMNSINLVVLNDELLFTQPHQLIHNTNTKVTKVMLEPGKLEEAKELREEGMLEAEGVLDGSKTSIGEPSLCTVLGRSNLMPSSPVSLLPGSSPVLHPPDSVIIHPPDSAVLHPPGTAVLHSSDSGVLHPPDTAVLLPSDTTILQSPDAVVLQSPDTDILQPPNTPVLHQADMTPISTSLQTQGMTPLHPNLHEHKVVEVVTEVEDPRVPHSASECQPGTDTHTMVVLSSVHAPQEFIPISATENTTIEPRNTVMDEAQHQEGERVLSHATW